MEDRCPQLAMRHCPKHKLDMMRLVVVIFFTSVALAFAQKKCLVKEKNSGEQRPCIFPFIVGPNTYNSCADDEDEIGKKWCSTKTSNHSLSLHVHVPDRGFWGFCTEDCHQNSTVVTSPNAGPRGAIQNIFFLSQNLSQNQSQVVSAVLRHV